MISKNAFLQTVSGKVRLLDGATGSALLQAGMERGCCQEKWILDHPEAILTLQRGYAGAGSEIIYAPTFQANPPALARFGLEHETEQINAGLIALSRRAAPHCLIAGNLTTLRMYMDTSDERCLPQMISAYRRQIRALVKGGADLLAAETLLHPLEATAILEAAETENAPTVMISFALKPDGTLRSGHEAGPVFRALERAGAAALGLNCLAADDTLAPLVGRLKEAFSLPLICKPNTGRAVGGIRPVDLPMFTEVIRRCIENGASLIGGCCGTSPEYIAALKGLLS